MQTNIKSVTYTKDYRLDDSSTEALKSVIGSVVKYRKFIWVNFLKHFQSSYEQSYFQILWKLLVPLVPVSVYVVLQVLGFLKGNSEMPRVIYVVIGMTFWQIFANSLTTTMAAPGKERVLLKKMNLPFILFYISSLGNILFDYVIRLLLILSLMIYLGVPFNVSWLALPIYFIPFVLTGGTIGMFLSFFSLLYGDVKNMVDIVIRYGLFASGVIFPIAGFGAWTKILSYNPIYIFIDNLRYSLVFGTFPALALVLKVLAVLLLSLLVVLIKTYRLEPRLREYL